MESISDTSACEKKDRCFPQEVWNGDSRYQYEYCNFSQKYERDYSFEFQYNLPEYNHRMPYQQWQPSYSYNYFYYPSLNVDFNYQHYHNFNQFNEKTRIIQYQTCAGCCKRNWQYYENVNPIKPLYSYAQLISQAILNSKNRKIPLIGIYRYISNTYPYYQINEKGWQNSIRHNLSLNKNFFKIPRNLSKSGKGCLWTIPDEFYEEAKSEAFKIKSRKKLPSQSHPVFTPYPNGVPPCFPSVLRNRSLSPIPSKYSDVDKENQE
ncbi:hypothetical protein HZS_385, partial [Henneguya salminicola]